MQSKFVGRNCRIHLLVLLGVAVMLARRGAVVPAEAGEHPSVGKSLAIRVNNPRRLDTWQLTAERVAIGPGYKPSMALLASGELVLVALFQDRLPIGKVREWTGLWRSRDQGQHWTPRQEVKDLIGREQWLTGTKDGTLFATCHLLAQDINNKDGYTHSAGPERQIPHLEARL